MRSKLHCKQIGPKPKTDILLANVRDGPGIIFSLLGNYLGPLKYRFPMFIFILNSRSNSLLLAIMFWGSLFMNYRHPGPRRVWKGGLASSPWHLITGIRGDPRGSCERRLFVDRRSTLDTFARNWTSNFDTKHVFHEMGIFRRNKKPPEATLGSRIVVILKKTANFGADRGRGGSPRAHTRAKRSYTFKEAF